MADLYTPIVALLRVNKNGRDFYRLHYPDLRRLSKSRDGGRPLLLSQEGEGLGEVGNADKIHPPYPPVMADLFNYFRHHLSV